MPNECCTYLKSLVGIDTPVLTTRQRMIDVFRSFKQGELTNMKAGKKLASMKEEAGLEDIRDLFITEWEGAFYARYRWDKAPKDIRDAVDRALLFMESGCSLPPRPPATASQQRVLVTVIVIVSLLYGALAYVTMRLLPDVGVVDILLGLFETLCVMFLIIVTIWRFAAYLIKKIKGAPLPIHDYWPFENEAHHETFAREHRLSD